MANERKRDSEHDDHTPEFVPHPPLDKGDTAEPKHTEAAPLVPIVPLGS
jgi:hypothetical protein